MTFIVFIIKFKIPEIGFVLVLLLIIKKTFNL